MDAKLVIPLVLSFVSAVFYMGWTLGQLTTSMDALGVRLTTLETAMGTVEMEIRLLNDKLTGLDRIARAPRR